MGLGIMISIGKSGGTYYHSGWAKRLALGPVAITIFPMDGDEVLYMASMWDIHRQALVAARLALSDEIEFRKADRRPVLAESEGEAEYTMTVMGKALDSVEKALEE